MIVSAMKPIRLSEINTASTMANATDTVEMNELGVGNIAAIVGQIKRYQNMFRESGKRRMLLMPS